MRDHRKERENECLLLGFGISENNKYVWEAKDCVFLKADYSKFLSFFFSFFQIEIFMEEAKEKRNIMTVKETPNSKKNWEREKIW